MVNGKYVTFSTDQMGLENGTPTQNYVRATANMMAARFVPLVTSALLRLSMPTIHGGQAAIVRFRKLHVPFSLDRVTWMPPVVPVVPSRAIKWLGSNNSTIQCNSTTWATQRHNYFGALGKANQDQGYERLLTTMSGFFCDKPMWWEQIRKILTTVLRASTPGHRRHWSTSRVSPSA